MDWQQVVSLGLVAAALVFLFRRTLARKRGKAGCGPSCNCGTQPAAEYPHKHSINKTGV